MQWSVEAVPFIYPAGNFLRERVLLGADFGYSASMGETEWPTPVEGHLAAGGRWPLRPGH
jgi:hypothetical protein